jgi:hypothetical protein
MFYFNTLPKIITPDENGNNILLTNLVTRAKLIEKLRNNPLLFYEYAIQEGDTPEIVAEKYYGDPYRYWIVLLSNEILDPLWDWPLDDTTFYSYIDAKYETEAEAADQTPFEYTNTQVYQYQKIQTIKNLQSDEEKTSIINLTQSAYNSLITSVTNYTLPDSTVTRVTIDKKIVTLFDYESNLNESRRQIKLLNEGFVGDLETTFRSLMEVR